MFDGRGAVAGEFLRLPSADECYYSWGDMACRLTSRGLSLEIIVIRPITLTPIDANTHKVGVHTGVSAVEMKMSLAE